MTSNGVRRGRAVEEGRRRFTLEEQRAFWNAWNSAHREGRWLSDGSADTDSLRRGAHILAWLEENRPEGPILEVGCGAGWFCRELRRFGPVTGIDLADAVIEGARRSVPDVEFLAGDVQQMELPEGHYGAIVTMEVMTHIPDQEAFALRLASLLRPDGRLFLTTQNRFVMERSCEVMEQERGQVRRWLDRRELLALLSPHFQVEEITSLIPGGDQGILRLVNSYKLNRLAGLVVSADRLARWKEAAGFGKSLVVRARRG